MSDIEPDATPAEYSGKSLDKSVELSPVRQESSQQVDDINEAHALDRKASLRKSHRYKQKSKQSKRKRESSSSSSGSSSSDSSTSDEESSGREGKRWRAIKAIKTNGAYSCKQRMFNMAEKSEKSIKKWTDEEIEKLIDLYE